MQKITTFLAFDNQAEEAVQLYTSLFKNSKVTSETRNGENGPGPAGSLLVTSFELDGQKFMAMNGGPYFTFTQGFSLMVNCETQDEIDHFWDKLSEGGEVQQCGWLRDKFGVSWQITPTIFGELMQDEDPEKSGRVLEALMQMVKIDIAALKRAFVGD